MEIDLEVSESEDFSEFPVIESVEKKLNNNSKTNIAEGTSLASEKKIDKATQTISKRVWRKIKKKE